MTAPVLVDLDAPGWLGPWLRAVHAEPIAVDLDQAPWLAGGSARGRFLSALEARCHEIRSALLDAWPAPPVRPSALRTAAVLAWSVGADDAARALAAEAAAATDDPTHATDVAPTLRRVATALTRRLVDDDQGVVAAGFGTLLDTVDTALCVRIAARLAAGEVDDEALAQAHAQAQDRRRVALRAVVALVVADRQVTRAERTFTQQLARVAGLDKAGLAELDDWLRAPPGLPPELDDIGATLDTPELASALVRLLHVASLIDGDAAMAELQLVSELGARVGLSDHDVLRAQVRVARDLDYVLEIGAHLERDTLLDRLRRRSERQIRGLVRRHVAAIGRELRETGDLVQLLLASTRRSLTADEQARMQRQLLDLCRTVPALAIFAAPGGGLLLPVLARVLPFSLAPSGFRDEGL